MTKVVQIVVPEATARQFTEWTPCEAFRFVEVDDGTVRLELKGLAPTTDRECDWCHGKGHVVQYGPDNQTAKVPCVRCKGRGRLDA